MGEITQILRHEHDTILYVLKILNNMVQLKAADNAATYGYCIEITDFLQLFAEKSHHGKVAYLMEALKEGDLSHEGDTLGDIQHEHAQLHALILKMIEALDSHETNEFNVASVQCIALLENSINKENLYLFTLADQALDEEKQDELLEKFVELEKEVIGRDLHRKMHDMISKWAGSFGVG